MGSIPVPSRFQLSEGTVPVSRRIVFEGDGAGPGVGSNWDSGSGAGHGSGTSSGWGVGGQTEFSASHEFVNLLTNKCVRTDQACQRAVKGTLPHTCKWPGPRVFVCRRPVEDAGKTLLGCSLPCIIRVGRQAVVSSGLAGREGDDHGQPGTAAAAAVPTKCAGWTGALAGSASPLPRAGKPR